MAREESGYGEVSWTLLVFWLTDDFPIIGGKTVRRQHVASQNYQWAEFWRSMGSGWALLGDVQSCMTRMKKRSWSHF